MIPYFSAECKSKKGKRLKFIRFAVDKRYIPCYNEKDYNKER